MLRVFFHPRAKKDLLRLPKKIRLAVLDELEALEKHNHPLQHRNVIKLSGSSRKDFRLRVGSYRVKFTLRDTHKVFITSVDHRQAGY